MKVIIAGSRDFTDYRIIEPAVRASGFAISEVVSGGARGADRLGERYSREKLGQEPKVFYADWNRYGRVGANHAGKVRNREMGDYAEALLAFTLGTSGTEDMIAYMRGRRKLIAILDMRSSEWMFITYPNTVRVPFFEVPVVKNYFLRQQGGL